MVNGQIKIKDIQFSKELRNKDSQSLLQSVTSTF